MAGIAQREGDHRCSLGVLPISLSSMRKEHRCETGGKNQRQSAEIPIAFDEFETEIVLGVAAVDAIALAPV